MEVVQSWYDQGIWRLEKPFPAKERLPLSQDLGEAMAKLREMDDIYEVYLVVELCTSILQTWRRTRGQGSETDCIFKLRERISFLSEEIRELASKVPHTLHTRKKPRVLS